MCARFVKTSSIHLQAPQEARVHTSSNALPAAESPVQDRIGAYGSFNERDGLKHQGQLDALQRLVDSLQQELKTGAKLVDELQSKSKEEGDAKQEVVECLQQELKAGAKLIAELQSQNEVAERSRLYWRRKHLKAAAEENARLVEIKELKQEMKMHEAFDNKMIRELLEELTIAVDCNSALTKRVTEGEEQVGFLQLNNDAWEQQSYGQQVAWDAAEQKYNQLKSAAWKAAQRNMQTEERWAALHVMEAELHDWKQRVVSAKADVHRLHSKVDGLLEHSSVAEEERDFAVQQISQDMQSQLSIKDSHVSSLVSLVQHLQCQLAEEQAHKAFHKFRLELQFAAGQQAQDMLAKAQASERAAQLSLHMMVVQADYLRRANLLAVNQLQHVRQDLAFQVQDLLQASEPAARW